MTNTAIRKVAVPVVVIVAAGILMYSEILTLLRGEPLGSGISDIVVGVLALLLYLGFALVERTSITGGIGEAGEKWSIVALLTAAIGINAVLIYTVPDSPEAVGMLVVCAVGVLIILFGAPNRRSSSQS